MTSAGQNFHESYKRSEPTGGSSNRGFGFVFAVFFLIIALWPLIGDGPVRLWAAGVSAAFAVVALAVPRVLGPLNRLWMRFGLLLNRIVNPIIMGLLFFGIVTPMSLTMRLFGKRFLQTELDRGAGSYWIERRPAGPPPESMGNQF